MYSESLVDKVHKMYKSCYHTITAMAYTVKDHYMINYCHNKGNRICGVMVIVVASSAVDRGSSTCRIKYKKKLNRCFSTNHAALALWSKSKDWLDQNQDDV
jgi:hypothetical protein